ncbi:hypothetical protein J132_02609 [Termitomyces sp. J132]|nr:hypothetical protein J132_02609 [Termitomyces sp. J132]
MAALHVGACPWALLSLWLATSIKHALIILTTSTPVQDGLPVGLISEPVSSTFFTSSGSQDAFATRSFQKASTAQNSGKSSVLSKLRYSRTERNRKRRCLLILMMGFERVLQSRVWQS